MFGFHKPKLIMPIHKSLRLYSQRLNVVASTGIAYLVATGGSDIPNVLSHIPGKLGLILAPLAGLISFGIVSYLRLHPQGFPDLFGSDADDTPTVQ